MKTHFEDHFITYASGGGVRRQRAFKRASRESFFASLGATYFHFTQQKRLVKERGSTCVLNPLYILQPFPMQNAIFKTVFNGRSFFSRDVTLMNIQLKK